MRKVPHLKPGTDSCYCKGCRWLVTSRLHTETYKNGLSVHAKEGEIKQGAIPHKDYYPGDIIEDRYFAPHCYLVQNGVLELYDGSCTDRVRRFRSIDDPGEYGN